ncbi:hypothetical protein B0T26DRAFT_751842 [Lasiosphaeria miniovina]|uniref:Deacetylase sirtuin-type domain-containing protein n=1 Tax=Lasiosphaeria miniovina TaxID=1954250 RepID=A0AA40DVG0_9PEZI|nr:uncharacterized protein B0T26DRAFT_751842 [Lasiosphaeria miniovina]KAK0717829.1 hypothetical protein B0T26DRAFT_751842 [Lasiosphaeria miniovina]
MPTTHVVPDSASSLQDIANSLFKARKVVVITGAGISTNSGIPDFRSENGLYSLIQAQFDAAEAKGPLSSEGDADESDVVAESIDERPAKRRKISRDETTPSRQEPKEFVRVAVRDVETKGKEEVLAESATEGAPAPAKSVEAAAALCPRLPGSDVIMEEIEARQHALGPPMEPPGGLLSSETIRWAVGDQPLGTSPMLTLLPSPKLASGPPFVSSPPSMALDALRLRSDSDQTYPHTMSSSPLSSPPPIMFDPYQELLRGGSSSSSQSSSRQSMSSRTQSEEPSSASTPLLTSQSSFASSTGRTSLPNMKGRDLFDAQIWSDPIKTSVFYTFTATLRQKVRSAEPTSSHQFVSVLRDSRKLVRCYTQNIDQLEERVGLTTSLSLGPGSRYRFSHRTGRVSAVARGVVVKDAESSTQNQSQTQQSQDDTQQEQRPGSGSQLTPSASQVEDNPPAQRIGGEPSLLDGANVVVAIPDPLPQAPPSSALVAKVAVVPTAAVSVPTPPKRGVECVCLHGSLAELRCFVCARTASWDEDSRQVDILAGRQPTCPHCAGATAAREERGKRALGVGKLRPDIVLYGEEHPHAHLISPIVQHDLSLGPDMLLILGTSMRVHGLKVLVKEFAKAVHDRGGKVVFVNFTKPPESVWSDVIDYWVQWDCDAWVGDLQQRKPALWLPPGTVMPEDEKVKALKASRRQSGVESGKRKDGASSAPRKRKDQDKPAARKPPTETCDVIEVGNEPAEECLHISSEEMVPAVLPPLPASSSPLVTKVTGPKTVKLFPREPKLNPNAKRPASVRDHKLNGAYLVNKILSDLRRLSGGEVDDLPPSHLSSSQSSQSSPHSSQSSPLAPVAKMPPKKRQRKSAPAKATGDQAREPNTATESQDNANFDLGGSDNQMNPSHSTWQTSNAASSMPAKEDIKMSIEVDPDSISTAVKSRPRQRKYWTLVNGLEKLVTVTSEDVPSDVFRREREALQENEKKRRTSSKPRRSETLPKRWETLLVLKEAQTAPAEAQEVPEEIQTVPTATQSVPQKAQTAAAAETQPLTVSFDPSNESRRPKSPPSYDYPSRSRRRFELVSLTGDDSNDEYWERDLKEHEEKMQRRDEYMQLPNAFADGFAETDRLISRLRDMTPRLKSPIWQGPLNPGDSSDVESSDSSIVQASGSSDVEVMDTMPRQTSSMPPGPLNTRVSVGFDEGMDEGLDIDMSSVEPPPSTSMQLPASTEMHSPHPSNVQPPHPSGTHLATQSHNYTYVRFAPTEVESPHLSGMQVPPMGGEQNQTMEPNIPSPGPQVIISPHVGSPRPLSPMSRWQKAAFEYHDSYPDNHLSFPPKWMQKKDLPPPPEPETPSEQLKEEQRRANLLAQMREGRGWFVEV